MTAKRKPEALSKPAINTDPEFMSSIQGRLSLLPTDVLIEGLRNMIDITDHITPDFVDAVIEDMCLLGRPAPENAIEFLFDVVHGNLNKDIVNDRSKILAFQSLESLVTEKDDMSGLVNDIIIYLSDAIEDKDQTTALKILETMLRENN